MCVFVISCFNDGFCGKLYNMAVEFSHLKTIVSVNVALLSINFFSISHSTIHFKTTEKNGLV